MHLRNQSISRRLGVVALMGVSTFMLVCMTVQILRTDLDWQSMPLSFYLLGAYSGWVHAAYFALAIAIVTLAFGFYGALQPAARSAAALGLFITAALALVVTAWAPTDIPRHDASWHGFVHNIAALTAFLCVTTAMLLQSWRFRWDTWWRRYFRFSFILALICFVALWSNMYWREWPRGLTQKMLITLIVLWLFLATIWLIRCGLHNHHANNKA